MAYINSTRIATAGSADRFGGFVKTLQTALQHRRVYNQTVRELRVLSDRELNDLGIHRSMIAEIAREAAYGK